LTNVQQSGAHDLAITRGLGVESSRVSVRRSSRVIRLDHELIHFRPLRGYFSYPDARWLGGRESESPTSGMRRRERLRSLYKTSVEAYTAAVNDLVALGGKITEEEYSRVRTVLTEARNTRDAARSALEQHKQEHGC